MKKYPVPLLQVAILLFLSSCSTFIMIPRVHEPEINPEKKAGNIVFVNLFDYTLPVYVKEKNVSTYNAGVRKFEEGLLSSTSGDKPFKFFTGDSLKKGTEVGQLTTLLQVDSVSAICKRYNADMLLALDSLNIFIDWETIVDNNYDGGKTRTKNFYLYTWFYMSLYSTTGDLIDRSKVQRDLLYKSRQVLLGFGLITLVKPSIANATRKVETLAYNAGQDYVSKFYPQIIKEMRIINMGKIFRTSNGNIRAGNWSKAVQLLEPLVNSPDSKIANKARQNMAVAKEAAAVQKN
jgi:hypothetical protein